MANPRSGITLVPQGVTRVWMEKYIQRTVIQHGV